MSERSIVGVDAWGSLHTEIVELSSNNKAWHWSRQEPGSISVPEFIKLRASGNAMSKDGIVYLKKNGPDPGLWGLLDDRVRQAYRRGGTQIKV